LLQPERRTLTGAKPHAAQRLRYPFVGARNGLHH
jgi:hypothetical protein